MDSTLLAALIGAIATILAALLPIVFKRIRMKRGVLRGSIDQLIVPLSKLKTNKTFKDMLPKAKEIRMCGWSLHRTIDVNRHELRELLQRQRDVRILLLDPDSSAVESLDKVMTDTDILDRKAENWPTVTPKEIAKGELLRTIQILKDNHFMEADREIVRLCNSLLPVGMLMIECEDGTGWLSIVVYPLHPDWRTQQRLSFTLGNNKTELWRILKEQFDVAWEDPNFSHPAENDKIEQH